jgi:hypothetical protein
LIRGLSFDQSIFESIKNPINTLGKMKKREREEKHGETHCENIMV